MMRREHNEYKKTIGCIGANIAEQKLALFWTKLLYVYKLALARESRKIIKPTHFKIYTIY